MHPWCRTSLQSPRICVELAIALSLLSIPAHNLSTSHRDMKADTKAKGMTTKKLSAADWTNKGKLRRRLKEIMEHEQRQQRQKRKTLEKQLKRIEDMKRRENTENTV